MATITRYQVPPVDYRAEASIPNQFTGVASSATHTAVIGFGPFGGPVTSTFPDGGPVPQGLVSVEVSFSRGFTNPVSGQIIGTSDRYFWDIHVNDAGMFTDAMAILAIAKSDANPSLEIVASDAIPTSGSFSIPITAFTLSGFTYLQSQRSELEKLERELADMRASSSISAA